MNKIKAESLVTENDEKLVEQTVNEPPAFDEFGQFDAIDNDDKKEVAVSDVVEEAFGDFGGNEKDEPAVLAADDFAEFGAFDDKEAEQAEPQKEEDTFGTFDVDKATDEPQIPKEQVLEEALVDDFGAFDEPKVEALLTQEQSQP